MHPTPFANRCIGFNRTSRTLTLRGLSFAEPTQKKAKKTGNESIVYKGPGRGAKKDTSGPLPDKYHPAFVEAAWVDWWNAKGFFSQLKQHQQQSFNIVLPPPNVTGNLHIGHALTVSIQDAICRWRRMKGDAVTWIPGFDHAGIATQVVVEKMVMIEEGKTRNELGRDGFVDRVWKWKDHKERNITEQLRRLGASVDWNRSVFTLDTTMSEAVDEAFCRLHDQGLLYRAGRIVNWCCHLQSAISDIEVESKQLSGKTKLAIPGYESKIPFGVMSSFAYPLEDGSGEVVVSTTRLETMLGDVGVAVHPNDQRYIKLVGKNLKHPFTGRPIPILTDGSVDMSLGTGAVKLTPAHDRRDFELAERHNLNRYSIIFDEKGRVITQGPFYDMPRFVARRHVKRALESLGLFRGETDHAMVLPLCSRTGDVVEPMIRDQWFLDCRQMATQAIAAVDDGSLSFSPPFHAKIWKHFLEQQRDWCVSRQLWWGHRIPAYRVDSSKNQFESFWVSGKSMSEALAKAVATTGLDPSHLTMAQDEDVLDTWFSSALIPFSALGWPHRGRVEKQKWRDEEGLYPLSLMETGHDILFFWVARMVMLGLQLTNSLPFNHVLLHGMVRDAQNRKMSKSLGNVVDPVDVMTGRDADSLEKTLGEAGLSQEDLRKAREGQRKMFPKGIPECGTDALRFALCTNDIKAVDISIDILNIRHQRHFCNKIWQATRFFFLQVSLGNFKFKLDPVYYDDDDTRIMAHFRSMVADTNDAFENHNLHLATTSIHNFFWASFCSDYLESCKPFLADLDSDRRDLKMSVLLHCLEGSMRILHPFMPFITEELWQRLKLFLPEGPGCETICLAPFPS